MKNDFLKGLKSPQGIKLRKISQKHRKWSQRLYKSDAEMLFYFNKQFAQRLFSENKVNEVQKRLKRREETEEKVKKLKRAGIFRGYNLQSSLQTRLIVCADFPCCSWMYPKIVYQKKTKKLQYTLKWENCYHDKNFANHKVMHVELWK